jgi:hypothetical protein
MLAASAALLAQNNDSPDKSKERSSVPDVRHLVKSSIAATRRLTPTLHAFCIAAFR